jgi:hypothetical protein
VRGRAPSPHSPYGAPPRWKDQDMEMKLPRSARYAGRGFSSRPMETPSKPPKAPGRRARVGGGEFEGRQEASVCESRTAEADRAHQQTLANRALWVAGVAAFAAWGSAVAAAFNALAQWMK